MTRQVHDQFAKQFLEEFLSPLGVVEISKEIPGEVYQGDIWFSPSSQPNSPPNLGLLGQIATSPCLIEPYRNQPSVGEIRSCLLKIFSLHNDLQRKAKRNSNPLTEDDLPYLWILAPSASSNLLNSFGCVQELETWGEGVYLLPSGLKTGLVAINQLPITLDTLWLRLLGKGNTQQQAIDELLSLSTDNPLRERALEQVSVWRINLELRDNLTQDERELIMALSPAYLEWRERTRQEGLQEGRQEGLQEGRQEGLQEGRQEGLQEGRQEGRQEGLQEGQRLVVENLLKVRFGTLDEELLGVVSALLQLSPEEYSQALLQLSSLSREDLISRFGG